MIHQRILTREASSKDQTDLDQRSNSPRPLKIQLLARDYKSLIPRYKQPTNSRIHFYPWKDSSFVAPSATQDHVPHSSLEGGRCGHSERSRIRGTQTRNKLKWQPKVRSWPSIMEKYGNIRQPEHQHIAIRWNPVSLLKIVLGSNFGAQLP
jgi:hypothetical protein